MGVSLRGSEKGTNATWSGRGESRSGGLESGWRGECVAGSEATNLIEGMSSLSASYSMAPSVADEEGDEAEEGNWRLKAGACRTVRSCYRREKVYGRRQAVAEREGTRGSRHRDTNGC